MTASRPLRVAAIGLDHRHIYGQVGSMLNVGAELAGFWTEGEPETLPGFLKRFPDAKRFDDRRALLEDSSIDLVLIAAIPAAGVDRLQNIPRAKATTSRTPHKRTSESNCGSARTS